LQAFLSRQWNLPAVVPGGMNHFPAISSAIFVRPSEADQLRAAT
jgi:hypothetical protein